MAQVVREAELGREMQLVSVARLARCMVGRMLGEPAAAQPPVELAEAALRDFVTLSLLLGNDFVPALPALPIREGGLARLASSFAPRFSGGGRLSQGGPHALGGLSLRALCGLLRDIAADEDARLSDADERWGRRNRAPPPAALGALLPRQRYYVRASFGEGVAESLQGLCCTYVAGLAWASAYFSEGRVLSRGWYYNHPHAPCAQDLVTFLTDVDAAAAAIAAHLEATDERARPPADGSGAWQLLMVLPRRSAHLLPRSARSVMLDPSSGASHLYPEGFRVDTYLRDKEWEHQPLLPAMDVAILEEAVAEACASARVAPPPLPPLSDTSMSAEPVR